MKKPAELEAQILREYLIALSSGAHFLYLISKFPLIYTSKWSVFLKHFLKKFKTKCIKLAALCINIYIVGINQIYDVEVGFSPLFLRFAIGKCRDCPLFRAFY